MKFKLGQQVKVIKYSPENRGNEVGTIGTITRVFEGYDLPYQLDEFLVQADYELELVSDKLLNIKLKMLTASATVPTYATPGSACMDLSASENRIVLPGETMAIPTGLAMEIPEGFKLVIYPRSGISLRTPLRIANSIGICDEDYRNEIKVLLWNASEKIGKCAGVYSLDNELLKGSLDCSKEYLIRKGDRIAQCEVVPVVRAEFTIVSELSVTERTGGFGSSGLR
jgi:dUTP pyrophosphatase